MSHYNSIIVAVDGSKEAEYALKKAIDIAKRNDAAKLNLVNVIDTRSFTATKASERSVVESAQGFSEELLESYKKQAEDAGVKNVNILIEYGSPKVVITKEVTKVVDADLIICGATGLSAVERFLIGSVSEAIVRSAKCDVLVVRTPDNGEE